MKDHPNQLMIDFTVPAKDPLTVADIQDSIGLSYSKICDAIVSGRLVALAGGRETSEREHYVVPLKNYIAWLNNEFTNELYFRFPAIDPMTPERLARAMNCTAEHVRHLIKDQEFPNVQNFGRNGRPHYMIPLRDVVAFINRRRVGAYC